MTNQVAINWNEYFKWSAKNTMRANAGTVCEYPPVVEVLSQNDDETITVIVGHNDVGTRLVVSVYPKSGFVSEITDEKTEADDTYTLTEIDNDTPVTEDEARDIYTDLVSKDGIWDFSIEASGDELRLYAVRCDLNAADDFDSEWEATPGKYEHWTMISNDQGYMIIGELAS